MLKNWGWKFWEKVYCNINLLGMRCRRIKIFPGLTVHMLVVVSGLVNIFLWTPEFSLVKFDHASDTGLARGLFQRNFGHLTWCVLYIMLASFLLQARSFAKFWRPHSAWTIGSFAQNQRESIRVRKALKIWPCWHHTGKLLYALRAVRLDAKEFAKFEPNSVNMQISWIQKLRIWKILVMPVKEGKSIISFSVFDRNRWNLPWRFEYYFQS